MRVNPDVSLAYKKRDKNMPTLKSIEVAFGMPNAPVAWLTPRLMRLSSYVGTRHKLDPEQIEMIAQDIVREWSYLDLGEIDDFLIRFRTGEFGHFYGTDDPQLLLVAMREYLKKRSVEIAKEDSEQYIEQLDEWRKTAITWEQYCKDNGIDMNNPITELL